MPLILAVCAFVVSFSFPVIALGAEGAQGRWVSEVKGLMGTRFVLRAWVESEEQEKAIARALQTVSELENRWSPWIKGSDLQRLNEAAGGPLVKVASDTYALLERSVQLCLRTQRAFDPTFFALKPLYDLRKTPFVPPTEKEIRKALTKVDCRKIRLESGDRAGLSNKGMRIHLGGNAKGTALDRAAAVLVAAGIERFVVDGGGDVVVQGFGPKGPWRVGIQNPRAKKGSLVGVVHTQGGAVATSGDYERFVEIDGTRYHHIVDPRDGRPARGCMSATVTVPAGPNAGELADGLATVLCVRGVAAVMPLLRGVPGAEAAVIKPDGTTFSTAGFNGSLNWSPPK